MADGAEDLTTEPVEDEQNSTRTGGVRRILLAVDVLALVAILVAAGFFWGDRSHGDPYVPSESSVDAGFARDMATHHQQAITMAAYVRDNSTDPEIVTLAYDIESSQTIQLGEMEGWLDTWGVSRTSGTLMDWMPKEHQHVVDGLMPGMATPDQMTRLQTLHGRSLDVLFLQLMIRHHQGGLPMMQYARDHAHFLYVRNLAQSMLNDQNPQIIQMNQKLRSLGASPLPAPDA